MSRPVLHPLPSLLTAAALSLALVACGEGAVQAPGGVSAGEAKALEEAATMLDQRRLPPEALPPEAQPLAPAPEDMAPEEMAPEELASEEVTGDTAPPSSE